MKQLFSTFSYCSFICLSIMITATLFLTSCSKDTVDKTPQEDHYYISFKADGVQKEFKSSSFGLLGPQDTSGIYPGILGAYKDVVGSGEPQISLLLFSETPCSNPAVYQDPLKAVTHGGVKEPQIMITYVEEAGADGFQSLGLFSDMVGVPGYFEHAVADGRAEITEVGSDYIKGTFSATTFKSSDVNKKILITEGKFYLQRL